MCSGGFIKGLVELSRLLHVPLVCGLQDFCRSLCKWPTCLGKCSLKHSSPLPLLLDLRPESALRAVVPVSPSISRADLRGEISPSISRANLRVEISRTRICICICMHRPVDITRQRGSSTSTSIWQVHISQERTKGEERSHRDTKASGHVSAMPTWEASSNQLCFELGRLLCQSGLLLLCHCTRDICLCCDMRSPVSTAPSRAALAWK